MDNLILGGDLHQNLGSEPYSDKNKNIQHTLDQYTHKYIIDYTNKRDPTKIKIKDVYLPSGSLDLNMTHNDYKELCTMFDVECQSMEVKSGDSDPMTTQQVHASNEFHNMVAAPADPPMVLDDGIADSANMDKFFSRAVRIYDKTWAVGTNVQDSINPWTLYLSNAAVQNKLQNYKLIKGNMVLNFYVNGTKFHAGMLLAAYSYMSTNNEGSPLAQQYLVTRSQRPKLMLNVSTNNSGCMCLPFFYPMQFIAVTGPTIPTEEMGFVTIDSFDALTQLSGGTDAVHISCFAHMEDVKVAAPTTFPVALSGPVDFPIYFVPEPQASDEYKSDGPISSVASAVASAAGQLSIVPVLRPFALATQMGATAIGGIASLFGFSRPIQLANVSPMRNFPVSSLALCDAFDTSQKLTATGKQEITVDPRTVGLDDTDEMSIDFIVRRESYVTSFPWTVSQPNDTTIFSMIVTPTADVRSNSGTGRRVNPTALSYASRCFEEWSGSIRYRFQVVGTQFHRGRLAFIYCPSGGPIVPAEDPFNTTFNVIMDLDETRDITIEVPWQQDRPYRPVLEDLNTTDFTNGDPVSLSAFRFFQNGVFTIRVVNTLVTPDATLPIRILVSVSAGDDFQLMNPNGKQVSRYQEFEALPSSGEADLLYLFTPEPQSALQQTPSIENSPLRDPNYIRLVDTTAVPLDQKPLMYYGEKIMSIRQLIKRYTMYRYFTDNTTTNQAAVTIFFKAMPLPPGADPDGPDRTSTLDAYTYVGTTYLNYFRRCYAGWRGSIRWKFVPTDSQIQNMFAERVSTANNRGKATTYRPGAILNISGGLGPSNYARYFIADPDNFHGAGGAALTTNRTMNALEVEVPYAFAQRFSMVRNYSGTSTNVENRAYPGGDAFSLSTIVDGGRNRMAAYVAAGDDFSYFGFIGAPEYFVYDDPPADGTV